jgi:hypothetical protein
MRCEQCAHTAKPDFNILQAYEVNLGTQPQPQNSGNKISAGRWSTHSQFCAGPVRCSAPCTGADCPADKQGLRRAAVQVPYTIVFQQMHGTELYMHQSSYLALRINHKRPPLPSSDQDTVVDGHLISGKTGNVPFTDLYSGGRHTAAGSAKAA